jgi:YidC/Oxa1 family membrane protein insertase
MEKRVVLFLILSLAIIIGYDYLLKQMGIAPVPSEPERSAPEPASSGSATAPSGTAKPSPSAAPPAAEERSRTVSKAEETRPVGSTEQNEEVATPLLRAVFTNRGGVVTSWELTQYLAPDLDHPRPVQLVHPGGKFMGPLSIQTGDPAINKQLAEGLYRVERDFSTLDASAPTGHLTFTYQVPHSEIRVEKRLTFHFDSYLVDVSVSTEGLSNGFDVVLGTNFGIVEWGEGFIGLIGPAVMVEDKLEKDMPETELEHKGGVRWVALQDKYFLSVLIPGKPAAAIVRKEGDKLVSAGVRVGGSDHTAQPVQPAQASQPAAASISGTPSASLRLYAGPKKYDTLKALGLGLEDTIDFGWFIYGSWGIVKAVAKPLFYVLRFLYDFTHNYGVAIVLLTVGIKLLFVPLQYKSYKSMKDMQQVQPKVLALQTKYKDDRERLNRELIKLYRDHKVNPVGGCLPMLLQMPVFVALFNILYMTIDLRQAPFVLWIRDLSVQDPYYVLPVIMGVTMVIQQKIMPTTMDPTQAKVMLLLPAFLTVLFLTFPAGLVLYWLTNNVLTIAQQFITDRYIMNKPVVSPGAEAIPETMGDGQKSTGKRKKVAEKTEADSPIEG